MPQVLTMACVYCRVGSIMVQSTVMKVTTIDSSSYCNGHATDRERER